MNNLWIYLSILLCILVALKVLCFNFISKIKLDKIILVLILYIIWGLLSIIYILINNKNFKNFTNLINYKVLLLLLFTALLIVITTIILQKTLSITPHLGYTHLIINLNIIFTILLSYFLFNESLNFYTILGIIISIIGVSIVIYNSNC